MQSAPTRTAAAPMPDPAKLALARLASAATAAPARSPPRGATQTAETRPAPRHARLAEIY